MASRRITSVLAAVEVMLRNSDGRTDGDLLREFLQQKTEAAFAALVRRHGPMVLGVCRRILGQADDADDALQATFLVLATKAKSLAGRATLGDWLYGVARRTALNARRSAARRREMEKRIVRTSSSPEADWADALPILDEELSRLPEKYRRPIVLCDLEGQSRTLAARHLGWPEGTVAGRLARGRQLLANRLTKRGVTLSAGTVATALTTKTAAANVSVATTHLAAKAAALMATGQLAGSSVVSAKVVALSQGVLKTMLLSKLKTVSAMVIVFALVATGGSLIITYQLMAAAQSDPERFAAPGRKTDPNSPIANADRKVVDNKAANETRRVTFRAHLAKGKLAEEPQIRPAETIVVVPDPAETYLAHKPLQITLPKQTAFAGNEELYYLIGFAVGRSGVFNGQHFAHSNVTEARQHKAWNDGWKDGWDAGLEKAEKPNVDKKANTRRPIHTLPGHTDRLTSVAYSPDGKFIATAAWDGTARIWDVSTGQEVRRLDFPATKGYNTFSHIAFSSDSAFVVTSVRESRDASVVVIWDRRTGEKVRTFPAEAGSVAISPDGRLIACGGYRLIRFYDFVTGKLVREIQADEKQLRIDGLNFSPDGKSIISTGHPETPQLGDGVRRLTIMPDVARVWNVATGAERPSRLNGVVVGRLGQHIEYSPDGRTLVAPSGREIVLLEVATGAIRGKLIGHENDTCAYAFLPDGRTMASGSMDGTVRLWDIPSGKELGRFGKLADPFKGGWILSVAFSPDGRALVAGGLDKIALVWDVGKITQRSFVAAERTPADLDIDWKALADDPATAYAAIGRLVASGGPTTVAFLGKQLQSTKPPDMKRIEQLIANLDDKRFQIREQATKDLETEGEFAGAALAKALAANPPLEIKRRLETLLARLDAVELSADAVRQVRAVEALEFIGTPEARRVLEALAASVPETRLTREAKAAFNRDRPNKD